MPRYKNKYRSESIRLKDWDYTTPWWYFITVNTKYHKRWFGKIINGEMILNEYGIIVYEEWLKTKTLRDYVDLDAFVVMPSHIHGIIILNDNPDRCDVARYAATAGNEYSRISPKPGSLPAVVRAFKSAVTKRIHLLGNLQFQWQSLYWDRIIRNDSELFRIRKYVIENPLRWEIEKQPDENIF